MKARFVLEAETHDCCVFLWVSRRRPSLGGLGAARPGVIPGAPRADWLARRGHRPSESGRVPNRLAEACIRHGKEPLGRRSGPSCRHQPSPAPMSESLHMGGLGRQPRGALLGRTLASPPSPCTGRRSGAPSNRLSLPAHWPGHPLSAGGTRPCSLFLGDSSVREAGGPPSQTASRPWPAEAGADGPVSLRASLCPACVTVLPRRQLRQPVTSPGPGAAVGTPTVPRARTQASPEKDPHFETDSFHARASAREGCRLRENSGSGGPAETLASEARRR